MTGQNGRRAIKLFGNQNAGNLVRPGQFSQSQNQIGTRPQRRIVPIRATDGNNQLPFAVIAHAPDALGKGFGTQRLAALVEQNEGRAIVQRFIDALCFFRLA